MDRKTRIRFVVVATIGLFNTVMGLIGIPIIVTLWFSPDMSGDVMQWMLQSQRTVSIANTASLICLAVAGICAVYLLAMIATWFIGSPEDTTSEVS